MVEVVAIDALDGAPAGLALLEQSDGPQLRRFFFRLSPETLFRRFHSPIVRPEQAQPQRLLDLDHRDREAVVAVVDGEIVGVARYSRRSGAESAEVAVVVADAWQRQGVGTRILSALADRAAAAGVQQFTMTMQADNRAVLRLLARFHPGAELSHSQGMLEAVVPLRSSGTSS